LTAKDDTLPDRFFDDPIGSGPRKGERLDRQKFMANIQFYYEMMGWDKAGRPTEATLYDHRLGWVLLEG
jgi:aldehyde:ferredoxin oxidoreductase